MRLSAALLAALLLVAGDCAAATDRPIVGILTVPTASECVTALQGRRLGEVGGGSCFHALYPKYIEAAGARVVPIPFDASDEKLASIFKSVNGVLFTGGDVNIKHADRSPQSSQYLHAATLLFNMTLAANDAGEHVPLWGTCMGLQTISIIVAGSSDVLESGVFDSHGISLPLDLTHEAAASRMLGKEGTPPRILRWLATENVTSNLHHDGIAPDTFATNGRLASFFSVLSTNLDLKGRPFVSTIEGRRYPVYAVQWHPERPVFQWDGDESGIDHSPHAVEAMQYFANFFVAESRRNAHKYASSLEERAALIYNYAPRGRDSYQAYIFQPAALRAEPSLATSATAAAAPARPEIEQQVTWLYARSLQKASSFVSEVMELRLVLDQGPCRIYRAAPEHFLGVCDSRPPPQSVPPVTYTIVVSTREAVDRWHGFLSGKGEEAVVVTSPARSSKFDVYAFNFYDPDRESSLGYYRFEVQTFESAWVQPTCPPVDLATPIVQEGAFSDLVV